MKTITTLSLAAMTALLIGCGGGGGGTAGTSSSAAGGAVSSAAGGNTSSQASQGFVKFDARNLSGYTVFVEDKDHLSASDKEDIFIFETGTQVKIVVNRNDGGQVVYEGTYDISDVIPNLFTVEMTGTTKNDSTPTGFSLLLENDYNIKENQLGAYVTKIVSNESNGVVIKDNTPTAGGLTVNSVDNVWGHTITSNVANPGTSGATMELSIAFKCDGSFDYFTDYAYGGNHTKNNYTGNEVDVANDFGTTSIGWYYTDEDGERSAGQLETDVNNQLLEGACWSLTNGDGSCSNDLKIKSITGSGC